MRLATWNVLHGRSPADGRVDASRLAQAVADLDADVLALQEVDRGQPRSGWLDVTAVAAEAMAPADSLFAATVIGDPAATWRPATDEDHDAPEGEYGVALVSRFPVSEWHLLRLDPAPGVRAPILVPGSQRVLWLRDEPRAVLAATVETPVGTMTVASTHLSFVPGVNVRQLREAMAWLRELPGPLVLMGDLNLPAAVVPAVTGARLLGRARTYPLPNPRLQVDHVLADGDLPPVLEAYAPRPPLSDHAPLVVDLDA